MGSAGCLVSSWTTWTLNVQEGTLVDAAKHDLVGEPFDHGLSHESKI